MVALCFPLFPGLYVDGSTNFQVPCIREQPIPFSKHSEIVENYIANGPASKMAHTGCVENWVAAVGYHSFS